MKAGILFLDDDVNLLSSVRRYLRSYSDEWQIYYASAFEEAVQFLENKKIDLAFLDINLPGKNGFELLDYIKSQETLKTIEIVMITGLNDSMLKRKALDIGATDLLQKPIKYEDLIARIRATLKTKLFHDELMDTNERLKNELIASQKMEITGVLAAGIMHDIRNVINIIQNYPTIIKSKLEKKQIVEKELNKIEIAASRAESILQHILVFAKHEEAIDDYLVNIHDIINDTIAIIDGSIPYNIKIVKLFQSEYVNIPCNPTYITQIILNLVINAREALGKSKGVIEIKTSSNKAEDGSYLFLSVSDNGPGIPEDIKKNLFKSRKSSKTQGNNFGFGLSTIKLLVEKLNGEIEVVSELNKGTRFIIKISVEDE